MCSSTTLLRLMLAATLLPAVMSFTLGPAIAPRRLTAARSSGAACTASTDADVPAAAQMETLLRTCRSAAETKAEDSDIVVDALLGLEKLARSVSKEDDGQLSRETLAKLDGSWRLVFTTGTIDTQQKTGRRINYFPIKAVQSFDTSTMKLTNGIYVGDLALIQFFGPFDWLEDRRKLEFDFDEIAVLGFRFTLPKGGAAEIGASTGLGSKGNVQRAKSDKKAFFNWISADDAVATARGGGGGLALWRRDGEMEERIRAGESPGP